MSTNESQELDTHVSSLRNEIASMSAGDVGVYSTFKGEDFETRKQVLAALMDPQPIADNLGKTINLANVIAQAVEVADDNGVLNETVRVILVDDKGTSYAGLSDGLFRSIRNIFGILGEPATWPGPLPVKVTEEKSRKGFRFFTIKVA